MHYFLVLMLMGGVHLYAKTGMQLDYKIEIQDFTTHEAHITMTMMGLSGNSIGIEEVKLGGKKNRIKKDKISQFQVINQDTGKPLTFKQSNEKYFDGRIMLDGAKNIAVSYVILKDDDPAASGEVIGYIGNDFGIFSGGQLLLAPYASCSISEAAVAFSVPQQAQVVAPFEKKGDKYYPLSYSNPKDSDRERIESTLYSSTMAVGDFRKVEGAKIAGTQITSYIYSGFDKQYDQAIAQSIDHVISYQTKLFGQGASKTDVPYMAIFYPNACKNTIWVGESCFSQGINIYSNSVIRHCLYPHQTFHRWNGWLWGSIIFGKDNIECYVLTNHTTGAKTDIQAVNIGGNLFFDIEAILKQMQFEIIRTDDTLIS